MKPRDILVATHGHCFDGMASAALFTHLARTLEPAKALSFRYKSCGYGPAMQMIPESWLDGDESAILDFRYTPSKKVTWYFDHHITGFATTEERDSALAGAAKATGPGAPDQPQVHYDPAYGSCAKLIADVAATRFGAPMSAHQELIDWADRIDSARFDSAEDATRRDEPVLHLAAVIEHHGDGPFLNDHVEKLLSRPVTEVARSPEIQALWRPIAASRDAFTRRVEKNATRKGRVVHVDLTDAPLDVAAKFVTYALFPDCTYSVTLSRNRQHYKLSIGYNPWSGHVRLHDIASICRRLGGGGHPAVGACSFPLSAREKALATTEAVVAELNA